MAQRQVEQIVDSIRQRRRQIATTLGNPRLSPELRDHIRRHRLPWTLGGLALGAVAVHLAVPVLLIASRGMIRRWFRSNFQAVGFRVASIAVRRVQQVVRVARAAQVASPDRQGARVDVVAADQDASL